VILSATDGKIITTLPLAGGSDGAVFNPNTMEAFSSSGGGSGSLSIIKENSPTDFVLEDTVTFAVPVPFLSPQPTARLSMPKTKTSAISFFTVIRPFTKQRGREKQVPCRLRLRNGPEPLVHFTLILSVSFAALPILVRSLCAALDVFFTSLLAARPVDLLALLTAFAALPTSPPTL